MEHIAVISEGKGEYSEKHSKFLGFIMPCNSESEAADLIAEKRKKYWDARHIVYAFILSDGTARFSDDGEPHGTAGKPVLEVLESSGIKNAVIVVVRYFGGTLLGTGGLVRAYTAASLSAVENAEKARTIVGKRFSVSVNYCDYDKLIFILREFNADIKKTDYLDKVEIEFVISENISDAFISKISDTFSSVVVPKFEEKAKILEKV